MNLLVEIENAIKSAEDEMKDFRGPMGGNSGKGADFVLEQMSDEAQAKWKEANLPTSLLAGRVDDLETYADMCGVDLTNV